MNLINKIIKLFKVNNIDMINQRDVADKLFKENPDLAMRIAMGEENAPKGILPAAVYAKVCEEAENAVRAEVKDSPEYLKKLDVAVELVNSRKNEKLSTESRRLKLRDPSSLTQTLETLKDIKNARIKEFEKTLPKGKTYEMAIKEEVENIKKSIDESKPTEKDLEDFIDSLGENKK